MQNQTSVKQVSLKDRLWHLINEMRTPIGHVLSGIVGFLFAGISMPWAISPFGAAWVSAQDEYILSAALGSTIGYFFTSDPSVTMRSIAAIALLAGLRWVFSAIDRRTAVMAYSPLIAAFSLAVTQLASFISIGGGLYMLLSGFAEMILAAGVGFFLIRTHTVIQNRGTVLRQSDYICFAISGCVFAMSVMQMEILGFSPGRMLAVLTIFICGYYGGSGAGSVVGVVLGVAATLTGSSFLMAPYAIGGLCAAVFAPTGRLMSTAAFAVVGGIAGIMTGGGEGVTHAIVETAAASAAFLVLPASPAFIVPLRTLIRSGDTAVSAQLAGVRLQKAAGALTEMANLTEEVAGRLDAMAGDDIERVYTNIADSVCKNCRQSPACWQAGYSDTRAALSQAAALVRAGGQVAPGTLPDALRRTCIHPDQMATQIGRQVGDYLGRQGARRQAGRMRSLVNDQFAGMALLLTGLHDELAGIKASGRTAQATIEQYFAGLDVEPVTVICYEDRDGRLMVDVTLPAYKLGRVDETEAALAMGEICEENMGLPEVSHSGDMVQLVFAPVAEFTPTFAYVQRAAGGSRLCGDSFVNWADRLGSANMVLSDGMGAGGAAAVDSTLTTTLVSRLVGAGARFDAALRMVNSALLVKSPEESLTTIDACSVDLYTGRARLYKAGAAPTFIIRPGKVASIESTSLPVGILRGVAFEESSISLAPGIGWLWCRTVSHQRAANGYPPSWACCAISPTCSSVSGSSKRPRPASAATGRTT